MKRAAQYTRELLQNGEGEEERGEEGRREERRGGERRGEMCWYFFFMHTVC